MLSNHKKFEALKYLTERLKNSEGHYEIKDSIVLQEIASDWGYSWNDKKAQWEKVREKRNQMLKVVKQKIDEANMHLNELESNVNKIANMDLDS